MFTINLSGKESSSHSPYNKIFFNSQQEAKAWFEENRAETIATIKKYGHDVEEAIESPYSLNCLPIEKEHNKICAPFDKEAEGRGYNIIWAIEAYLQSELTIVPAAIVMINGEQIENKFALQKEGDFKNRLGDYLDLEVRKKIIKKEIINSVTINGVEKNNFFFFELFANEFQTAEHANKMSLQGWLPYEDAVEAVFGYKFEDHCKPVYEAIRFAAEGPVKRRLDKLEEFAKLLKKL